MFNKIINLFISGTFLFIEVLIPRNIDGVALGVKIKKKYPKYDVRIKKSTIERSVKANWAGFNVYQIREIDDFEPQVCSTYTGEEKGYKIEDNIREMDQIEGRKS